MIFNLGKPSKANRRAGASIVEFAVVAPVFFTLVLGVFELGRALMAISLLNHAARVGCRKAMVGTLTTTQAVKDDVSATLTNLGIPSNVTVNVAAADNNATALTSSTASGTEISVVASVPVGNISWVPGMRYLTGNLQGQYTGRKE